MFNPTTRYITRGINEELPGEIILLLWHCIDELQGEIDYLQIFTFTKCGNDLLAIHHQQEKPPRNTVLYVPLKPEYLPVLSKKVFVIDDEDHSTMLLSSEY